VGFSELQDPSSQIASPQPTTKKIICISAFLKKGRLSKTHRDYWIRTNRGSD
jgi:hypothetical protein